MEKVATIGLDIAKLVFQVHGVAAEGKVLGRPSILSVEQHAEICAGRAQGISLGILAKHFGVSRAAIQRAQKRRPAD